MHFQSKKDFNYGLIYWGQVVLVLILIMFFSMKNSQFDWFLAIAIVVFSIYLLYLLSVWFGTSYKLEDQSLIVRSGPFRKRIHIEEIKKLEVISHYKGAAIIAPALSFHRINIFYGKDYHLISISPKDQKGLLKQLQQSNKEIKLL